MSREITSRKFSRRQFIKLAGTTAGAVALAACGAPTEAPPEEVEEKPAPTTEVPAKAPVEVGYMHFTAPLWEPYIKDYIAAFEENNPDIKIGWLPFPWDQYWEAVTTGMASGDIPDVLLLVHYNSDRFIAQGAAQPLDPFMEADNWDLSVYYNIINMQYHQGGHQYGVGWTCEGSCVFYNVDMFDEMGVEYPPEDGNWDWNDLIELAKKMTIIEDGKLMQAGIRVSLWPNEDSLADAIYSNGGRFIEDVNWSGVLLGEPEAREAIKFMTSLVTEHQVSPAQDLEDLFAGGFLSGRFAMYWAQSGRFANFLDAEFETRIAPVPVSPNTRCRAAGSSPNAYVMTRDAKHPEEAWRFMKWLGNGDSADSPQALWACDGEVNCPHIEANEKYWLCNRSGVDRQVAFDSYKNHFRYPHCPPHEEMMEAAHEEFVTILSGTDADEAIDKAVERCNKILEENPVPEGWTEYWEDQFECLG